MSILPNLARGEMVALSKAVSSSLLKIITILVKLVLCLLFLRLVMTVVVRMMIRKPWSVLVSRAHAYTKIIVCLLVPVFYPGSLRALAGCFP